MHKNDAISPSATPTTTRRSGVLSLYLLEAPVEAVPGSAGASVVHPRPGFNGREPVPPYARFRLCRGFLDDLNRLLPIRLRIQLEGELANGRTRGQVEGPALRFRWEFVPA